MSPVKLIKLRLIQHPFLVLGMHQTTYPWESNDDKGPFPLQEGNLKGWGNHHLHNPPYKPHFRLFDGRQGSSWERWMQVLCRVKQLGHSHGRKHSASGYAAGIRSKYAGSQKSISIHKQVDSLLHFSIWAVHQSSISKPTTPLCTFSCAALENTLLFSFRHLITSWTDDCLVCTGILELLLLIGR